MVAQLVDCSKFKNVGHLERGGGPSKDSLLHCNKALSCPKKSFSCCKMCYKTQALNRNMFFSLYISKEKRNE